jgi:deoxyribonuclease IV
MTTTGAGSPSGTGIPALGAHIGLEDVAVDPQAAPDAAHRAFLAARSLGMDHVQVFLCDPQGWKGPSFPHPEGAAGLRAAAAQAGIGLYVHAPYVINVATTNNRIRIPSRKLLAQQVAAATEVGALGLIVHGGHVTKDDDPAAGFANWAKAVDQIDLTCPVLIENTSGGENSMARTTESWQHLWDAVGHSGVGVCLDTCHAWAAGIPLPDAVEILRGITGRIDLVHCNNSRDAFASGRDRHASLAGGEVPAADIVRTVAAAGAPVILETPGDTHGDDLALLREGLRVLAGTTDVNATGSATGSAWGSGAGDAAGTGA